MWGSCIGFDNNYRALHTESVGNHNESVARWVVVLSFVTTTMPSIWNALGIQRGCNRMSSCFRFCAEGLRKRGFVKNKHLCPCTYNSGCLCVSHGRSHFKWPAALGNRQRSDQEGQPMYSCDRLCVSNRRSRFKWPAPLKKRRR